MLEVRKSNERGHADHGWLNSYHSFSFADYYDLDHMSFGALRVFNEDRVQPGKGFGTHGYRNMDEKRGRFVLVASTDGRDGSVTINQDVAIYAGLFNATERAVHNIEPGRRVYVHIARGKVTVNGNELAAGDALKAVDPHQIAIEGGNNAEILLFDLA